MTESTFQLAMVLDQIISKKVSEAMSEAITPQVSIPPKAPVSDLLTVSQCMEYLQLARQTIYGLVNRREIPFFKKGRLYFSKKELDEWLISSKKETKATISKNLTFCPKKEVNHAA